MARGLNIAVNIGGNLLPSLNRSAMGVERRMGQMVRRFRVGTAEMKAEWRSFSKSIKPIAGLAAAGGLSLGFKNVIGDGANFMHEVAALRLAGRTAGETARAIKQAHKTAAEVPTSTLTENLKILRETTGAYSDMAHAMENLSFNQRLGYMMTNVMGMDRDESMHKLVASIQALEIRGSAMDHHRYQKEMNSLFQASAFFAGKEGAFTPESLLGFAKTGALPLKTYDERFLTKILPGMITEVGSGDIIGTQASAFNKWLMGGIGTGNKRAAQYAKHLGLVDLSNPDNMSATGWKANAIKKTGLAMSDPLAWFEKVMLPALKKDGVDINSSKALNIAFSQLMTKETAKRFAMTLSDPLQRQRLHRDEANVNKAMSSEEGYKFMLANDPQAAWAKVMSKLDNLATILGEKVFTDKTISAIDKFASGIDKLSSFFDRHPTLAKGAVAATGLGAVGATAALFGGGGFLKFIIGGLFSGLATMLPALGTSFLNMLASLAPWIIRGLVMAFGLLSNPIGWAIILAGVGAAFVWYFWDDIKAVWNSVVTMGWSGLWQKLKDYALSIDWASVGMKIANFLTFGLAGRFQTAVNDFRNNMTNTAPSANVGMNAKGGGLAGMRANGGPVRAGGFYLVGERGPEIVGFGRNGYVTPNHHIRAMAGGPRHSRPGRGGLQVTVNVNGAQDPAAVAAAVRREFVRLANGQAALLSD